MTMFSTLWTTLRYTFAVRGYYATPVSSFPTRMGCKKSDMFRLSVAESESADGPITLQEFHAAFLSSPVFRNELWMLSKMGVADPRMTSVGLANDVASGEKCSFGPWTAWAVDGSREKAVTAQSDPVSACVVMRCYISGKPFCDTWWAVEKTPDNEDPELVFGTAMKAPYNGEKGNFMSSLLVKVLDPFHRLYSRILLASAKATLLDLHQQRLASAKAALDDLHQQSRKYTTTNEKAD